VLATPDSRPLLHPRGPRQVRRLAPRQLPLLAWALAAVVSILAAATAEAGPNSGGKLILHANPTLYFSTDGDYTGWSELNDCQNAITSVPGEGQGVIFYILAVFDFGSPTMKGTNFGIKYTSSLVAPVAWGPCWEWPGEGNMEYPYGNWPQSNSGIAVAWAEPLTDRISEVYWFAAYAYAGNTFTITKHPKIGTAEFGDDSIPSQLDEVEGFGTLGFGKAGTNPCGETTITGACCSESGSCNIQTEVLCRALGIGFTYLGDNEPCVPNPCRPGMGACCFGPECRLIEWDICLEANGWWIGTGVSCNPTPCDYTPIEASWGKTKDRFRREE